MHRKAFSLIAVVVLAPWPALLTSQADAPAASSAQQRPEPNSSIVIDLPTSKELIGEVPGHPQKLNSLPISMAVSPDARYVVTVNAGYGTYESQYDQSLSVLDTQTGVLADF